MATIKENYMKIIMTIIALLLSVIAFFAQDLVAGLKAEDVKLHNQIVAVDLEHTQKIESLTEHVVRNEKYIGLSEKDIDYIIKTLDEIKIEVKKK